LYIHSQGRLTDIALGASSSAGDLDFVIKYDRASKINELFQSSTLVLKARTGYGTKICDMQNVGKLP